MLDQLKSDLFKSHDETCDRCHTKISWLVYNESVDVEQKIVLCGKCRQTISMFGYINFPGIQVVDEHNCKRIHEVLDREKYKMIKVFMLKHPELDDSKVRKNSKLRKELDSIYKY